MPVGWPRQRAVPPKMHEGHRREGGEPLGLRSELAPSRRPSVISRPARLHHHNRP
jgi:hypothetical protein